MLTDKDQIGRALLLYDRAFFWEYSEREIASLGSELVVPRITRYGTLEDIIGLFVIYPAATIFEVVEKDRELDDSEKALLRFGCKNMDL